MKLLRSSLVAVGMVLVSMLLAQAANLDSTGRLVSEDGFVLLGEDQVGNLMYAKKFKQQNGALRRSLVKWEYTDGTESFDNVFWDCKDARYRFPGGDDWLQNDPRKMYDYVFQFVCR